MSEDKATKTAKLYHKMNWDKTNEELLRDYSAIDTSYIDDPKIKNRRENKLAYNPHPKHI